MRIGLITCNILPEPDPDDAPLRAALESRGHVALRVPWDAGDPPLADIHVLRSTWNYYKAPDDFLRWLRRAAAVAPLINPLGVVQENINKRYLVSLRERRVPIVPTRWIPRGDRFNVENLIAETGWNRFVLKPAVSAGSYRTRCFESSGANDAQRFAEQLLDDGDLLAQAFLDGFAEPGERALVWIDGRWTHAVRKHPRFAGESERVEADANPQEQELAIAEAAIGPWRDQLVYARVDLVPGADGSPLVSEVELIEPSLFFDFAPHALERFIDAIERHAR